VSTICSHDTSAGQELNPLSSPWPFAQWGLDIVGPLPRAPGNKRFLITATDYFTKWVEAEPLSNIRTLMLNDSSGKTLLHVSAYLGRQYRIMAHSLRADCSKDSVRNSTSKTSFPPLATHNPMGKPRSPIKSY
jgi:hypothetical protein